MKAPVSGFAVYLEPGEPADVRQRKIADAERTYLAAQSRAKAQSGAVVTGRLAFGRAVRAVRGAA